MTDRKPKRPDVEAALEKKGTSIQALVVAEIERGGTVSSAYPIVKEASGIDFSWRSLYGWWSELEVASHGWNLDNVKEAQP